MDKAVDDTVKEELARYIKQEMDNGYDLKTIKTALLQAGHHHNVIDEAISRIKHGTIKETKQEEEKVVKKELLDETVHTLKGFIRRKLKEGYSKENIEKQLYYGGHTREIIKEAIDLALKKEGPWYIRNEKMTIIGSFLAFIAILFILSATTTEDISIVATGFYPAILSMILAGLIIDRSKKLKEYIWFIPIVLSVVFYIFPGLEAADVVSLIILNMIFAYIYLYLLFIIKTYKEEIKVVDKI